MLGAAPSYGMSDTATSGQLYLPMRYGVSDNLESFSSLLLQAAHPTGQFGVMFQPAKRTVEFGLRLAVTLLDRKARRTAEVQLGLPMRVQPSPVLALFATLGFAVDFIQDLKLGLFPDVQQASGVSLVVPVGVVYNFGPALFAHLTGSVTMGPLAGVAAGGEIGYTVARRDQAWLDLGVGTDGAVTANDRWLAASAFVRGYFHP